MNFSTSGIGTLAEIRFGIELVPNHARRSELLDWLAHKVRPMFDQRTLEVTEDVMSRWRLLVKGDALSLI